MAARSPNYPAISLPDAVEMAQKLWKKEQRTAVPPEVAVKAFGYGALSGPARVAIGAMRKYGLLDKTPNGIKLSDLALRILHPESPQTRQAAIREAAFKPELFRELAETHANASDDALKSFLINKKRFVDTGTRVLISAFRDTIKLANLDQSGYSDSESTREPEAMPETSTNYTFQAQAPEGSVKSEILSLAVPFAKGTIAVQIRVNGEGLNARHLAAVRQYLKLTESNMLEWPEGDLPEQKAPDGSAWDADDQPKRGIRLRD